MEIRSATMDDYPSIAALSSEVSALHHAAHPTLVLEGHVSEQAIREALAGPNVGVLLCVEDGKVLGLLIYEIVDLPQSDFFYARHELNISEMVVGQAHRRKGCGDLLMKHAFEEARARGISVVTLRVWSFNESAQAFYEHWGFVPQLMKMSRTLD